MTKILINNSPNSDQSKVNNRLNQYKIKGSTISIILGDISEQNSDAVVNAANNHLWIGGGVAGALKTKCGEIIEQVAKAKGPVQFSDAVITTAGKLNVKDAIHAV